jgi:hypothetical protein
MREWLSSTFVYLDPVRYAEANLAPALARSGRIDRMRQAEQCNDFLEATERRYSAPCLLVQQVGYPLGRLRKHWPYRKRRLHMMMQQFDVVLFLELGE